VRSRPLSIRSRAGMSRCSATGFMTSSTEAGICEVFERNAAQGTGGIWPAGRRLDQRGPPQPRPPLLSFQLWQGLTLPERFHGVFSPSSCGLLPPLASHAPAVSAAVRVGTRPRLGRGVQDVVLRTTRRTRSVALVDCSINVRSPVSMDMDVVAAHVGCSRTALHEHFTKAFGLSGSSLGCRYRTRRPTARRSHRSTGGLTIHIPPW
jgi:AraC-like DNA-binding protein